MKVFLDYVGCRLNQAEVQGRAAGLLRQGHQVAAGPGEADLVLLNTCAVTQGAVRDSRRRLRAAGPDGFHWQGYTGNYLRVGLTSPKMLWNSVTTTRLVQSNQDGLVGSAT